MARFPEVTVAACAKEVHAIDADRRVYRGARAIAEVWRRLGGRWRVLGWLTAHPLAWPARLVYRWVAAHRGQLGDRHSDCSLEPPDRPL